MPFADQHFSLLKVLRPNTIADARRLGPPDSELPFLTMALPWKRMFSSAPARADTEQRSNWSFELTGSGNEAIATIALPHRSRGERSALGAL
jgi:hypothetical protein